MNGKGWLGLNGTTRALVTTGLHSSGSLPIGDIWDDRVVAVDYAATAELLDDSR